jgi:hypothetical protein
LVLVRVRDELGAPPWFNTRRGMSCRWLFRR